MIKTTPWLPGRLTFVSTDMEQTKHSPGPPLQLPTPCSSVPPSPSLIRKSTPGIKLIRNPTIFDDEETTFDTPLLSSDYGRHEFWETEDAREAEDFEKRFQDLAAGMSALYTPKQPEQNQRRLGMTPVSSGTPAKSVGSSIRGSKETSKFAMPSPPLDDHNAKAGSPKQSRRAATSRGSKRTRDVYEDREKDTYDDLTTPSRSGQAKRLKVLFTPGSVGRPVDPAREPQVLPNTSPTNERRLPKTTSATSVLAEIHHPNIMAAPKRKRSMNDPEFSFTGTQHKRTKTAHAQPVTKELREAPALGVVVIEGT